MKIYRDPVWTLDRCIDNTEIISVISQVSLEKWTAKHTRERRSAGDVCFEQKGRSIQPLVFVSAHGYHIDTCDLN